MEKDLKRLVELAKTGDQQAIAQLYEQTSRRAYYLAKQLVKDRMRTRPRTLSRTLM